MNSTSLILGIGNPGEEYEHTKHNIGYRVIKYLQKSGQFSGFEEDKKINALLSSDKRKKAFLILPLTFVNQSGQALKNTINYYKIKLVARKSGEIKFLPVFVIHDDIDLPVGKIKISVGRNSAGHKGVESIIKALKTKDFVRFRIGIQPPKGKRKKAEEIVLKKFSADEEKIISKVIKKTAQAVLAAVDESLEKSRNLV